jgi:hypothetical protein
MSEQDNYDALFNPKVDLGDVSNKASNDYQVSADKGSGGVYESIIRFIPWYKNPNQSITDKWVSWLIDPVTNKGRFVDCPSSVGKQSLIQDMFWKLKKSESVQEQKAADIFSRRHNYASLIQVIKDTTQPALEGKILVYRFGKKLWEKVQAEMKPIMGDPMNPFDMLHGKAFHLKITKVSGFNNYDQSKFLDKVIPLCMPDAEGKLQLINDNTDKGVVYNYLKTNSPDLDKYGFREWDQDTYDYVNGVIAAVTGQAPAPTNFSDINTASHGATPTQPVQSAQTPGGGITSTNISLDDLGVDKAPVDASFPAIDLPDLPEVGGIPGNLEDVLGGL